MCFAPPPAPAPAAAQVENQKQPREKRDKAKNDPELIKAVRELLDRWLEKVNEEPDLRIAAGKYEMTRPLLAAPDEARARIKRLEAA